MSHPRALSVWNLEALRDDDSEPKTLSEAHTRRMRFRTHEPSVITLTQSVLANFDPVDGAHDRIRLLVVMKWYIDGIRLGETDAERYQKAKLVGVRVELIQFQTCLAMQWWSLSALSLSHEVHDSLARDWCGPQVFRHVACHDASKFDYLFGPWTK